MTRWRTDGGAANRRLGDLGALQLPLRGSGALLDFRRQPTANGKMPVSSLAFCSLAIRTQQVAGWVSGSYCSCRVLVGESAALTSRHLMPSTADITHAWSCPDFSSTIVVPAWLLPGSSDRNDDSRGPCIARNDAAILEPDETVAASPRSAAAPCRFWLHVDDESLTPTPSRSCETDLPCASTNATRS
ncbi:hypothetical protein TRIATDRAFT_297969 [Trichoderma atroviride IMI 206040]|uniref:Uncharacterized protein n=2 Tax=Hypocrea atroviridis TaxID=63577 RepID=G9NKH3_HYPAI|nr:uncharacterized protein TRIATDRAFT_297969 [Trichoderma atroviride IMI 206040]EHK48396.1 hypothetical protein TRIATDRAFT_297969 [Trichoderma atroviride IMI 206040]